MRRGASSLVVLVLALAVPMAPAIAQGGPSSSPGSIPVGSPPVAPSVLPVSPAPSPSCLPTPSAAPSADRGPEYRPGQSRRLAGGPRVAVPGKGPPRAIAVDGRGAHTPAQPGGGGHQGFCVLLVCCRLWPQRPPVPSGRTGGRLVPEHGHELDQAHRWKLRDPTQGRLGPGSDWGPSASPPSRAGRAGLCGRGPVLRGVPQGARRQAHHRPGPPPGPGGAQGPRVRDTRAAGCVAFDGEGRRRQGARPGRRRPHRHTQYRQPVRLLREGRLGLSRSARAGHGCGPTRPQGDLTSSPAASTAWRTRSPTRGIVRSHGRSSVSTPPCSRTRRARSDDLGVVRRRGSDSLRPGTPRHRASEQRLAVDRPLAGPSRRARPRQRGSRRR